jgi:hypothetical protein
MLPGLIVFGRGAFTCDCAFRSLSADGARLAVKQLLQFPDKFHVINVRDGVVYDAKVLWNKRLDIGSKFEATKSLTAKADQAFDRLRELWLAKAPR